MALTASDFFQPNGRLIEKNLPLVAGKTPTEIIDSYIAVVTNMYTNPPDEVVKAYVYWRAIDFICSDLSQTPSTVTRVDSTNKILATQYDECKEKVASALACYRTAVTNWQKPASSSGGFIGATA